MKQQYLVISSEADEHISFVQKHLDRKFVLIDLSTFSGDREAAFRLHNGRFSLFTETLSLTNVSAVWYRRILEADEATLPVVASQRPYSVESLYNFGLLLRNRFPEAFWISDAYAVQRAGDKLLQLDMAHRIGFSIPETIVTSSPKEAKAFIASQKQAVTKPLDTGGYILNKKGYAFYTSKITTSADFSGLPLAPAIFQQAVDFAADIRVTVVGKKVFSAAITSESFDNPSEEKKHVRDWRISSEKDIQIEAHALSEKIAELCVAHVKELGLQFGAIDLVLDKKGKYWFLENNPNGQWAFVEDATKQPIGKAIAELLMQGKGI